MGADSLDENTSNTPKMFGPICLLKPKSLRFRKKLPLGVRSPWVGASRSPSQKINSDVTKHETKSRKILSRSKDYVYSVRVFQSTSKVVKFRPKTFENRHLLTAKISSSKNLVAVVLGLKNQIKKSFVLRCDYAYNGVQFSVNFLQNIEITAKQSPHEI